MSGELSILLLAAVTISTLHTLAGPDHYLPFIVLAKSKGWSLMKTISWTIVCGCGHVWSSVLLGLGGAAIGWTISKYNWMDEIRGGVAGWALLLFGLCYGLWGLWKAKRASLHKHFDITDDGGLYVYEHSHDNVVLPKERHKVTPWVMFIIFLLGPCEPMIPLLYFPGAKNSFSGLVILISVYTLSTLSTMVFLVVAGFYGTTFLKTSRIERYTHALGGFTIFVCGMGMVFMGW